MIWFGYSRPSLRRLFSPFGALIVKHLGTGCTPPALAGDDPMNFDGRSPRPNRSWRPVGATT